VTRADEKRAAFLKALAEDRYDTTTRLVYADWLDEQCRDSESQEQRRLATPEWCAADRWLREYAKKLNPYDLRRYDYQKREYVEVPDGAEAAFQRLIQGLQELELSAYGSGLHGLYELDDADELREQAAVWLGKQIAEWGEFTFSCSC